jgi:N-acetyl sugar amidotransferase
MELRRCTLCTLPETHETITFDAEGVCNICRGIQFKHESIDWNQRLVELEELVAPHRGTGEYDCVVPFSGGKDSTWTLYYVVKELGLRPLVVSFNHGFMRQVVNDNTLRTVQTLGVELQQFTPNWHLVRALMLQGLLERGDFCWHCHTGISAYPMWVAVEKRIPLVIWGEPSAEYTAYYGYDQTEEVDEQRFNRAATLGIGPQDMALRIPSEFDERDWKPFTYPPLARLREVGVRSFCLGSYVPWDVQTQSRIISEELGWRGDEVEGVPPEYSYEKIECYMQGIRDYLKFLKRGYTRPTHLTSIDIRNGRMTRDEGISIIDEWENRRPASLDLFLEMVGITESEFHEIAATHVIDPWDGKVPVKIGPRPADFAHWEPNPGMPRQVAMAQIDNFRANL